MKIKTAFKILITYIFLFLSLSLIQAQSYVYVDEGDVTVNANITRDLYTQLSLVPATVEIRQPATVNILALDWNSTPRPNRSIQIYISGSSTGITIAQPPATNVYGQTSGTVSSTIPGTYTVCAKDITEGYEILILDCETLYVTPVPAPVMLNEPQYTKGDKNIVMWNMPGSGIYQYYVESSTDIGFSSIFSASNWISNLSYEFSNLQNAQIYFYRTKARNMYGGESAWSNTVFSMQDSSGPLIEILSISDAGGNNTTEWEKDFSINIRYRIKDNIGISSREFWCLDQQNNRYECQHTASLAGDIWSISIKLKDLNNKDNWTLFNSYKFCVEAKDQVQNVTRNCDALFQVPDKESPEEPTEPEIPTEPKPPIIPEIPKIPLVEKVTKIVKEVFDNTIAKLEPEQLQDVTVTTATANVAVGFGFILTSLGYIPYFILQTILAILSLLGFRKKGNVTGYVYNSLTKAPIPQAIVRIFNESHELIWTDVTDSNGYFRTPDMDDAEYYMKITARNFTFPSKIVFGKTDFPLENVYHGDPFLTRKNKIPNFSIPMDQEEVSNIEKIFASFISRTKALWKSLHIILFLIGLLFSTYALYTTPIWINYVIVAIYIPALIALIFSFFSKKEKYGVVRDKKGKIVAGAIIGLNENQFDKLVSKRISDSLGRYKFIVNKGIYNISVMNSDLKVINEEKLTNLEVKEDGGNLLCPNIFVKKLEDTSKEDEIMEPPKEL